MSKHGSGKKNRRYGLNPAKSSLFQRKRKSKSSPCGKKFYARDSIDKPLKRTIINNHNLSNASVSSFRSIKIKYINNVPHSNNNDYKRIQKCLQESDNLITHFTFEFLLRRKIVVKNMNSTSAKPMLDIKITLQEILEIRKKRLDFKYNRKKPATTLSDVNIIQREENKNDSNSDDCRTLNCKENLIPTSDLGLGVLNCGNNSANVPKAAVTISVGTNLDTTQKTSGNTVMRGTEVVEQSSEASVVTHKVHTREVSTVLQEILHKSVEVNAGSAIEKNLIVSTDALAVIDITSNNSTEIDTEIQNISKVPTENKIEIIISDDECVLSINDSGDELNKNINRKRKSVFENPTPTKLNKSSIIVIDGDDDDALGHLPGNSTVQNKSARKNRRKRKQKKNKQRATKDIGLSPITISRYRRITRSLARIQNECLIQAPGTVTNAGTNTSLVATTTPTPRNIYTSMQDEKAYETPFCINTPRSHYILEWLKKNNAFKPCACQLNQNLCKWKKLSLTAIPEEEPQDNMMVAVDTMQNTNNLQNIQTRQIFTYEEPQPVANNNIKDTFGNNLYNAGTVQKTGLRVVIIDGSNVALGHSNGRYFSVEGLKICIDYFLQRGHKVKAFVPQFRLKSRESSNPALLRWLHKKDLVVCTPSREVNGRRIVSYDDWFIVQAAASLEGVIVSCDNFRDVMKANPNLCPTIEQRLLMPTWVDDMIIFPNDPLGRHGPTLDRFLRFP